MSMWAAGLAHVLLYLLPSVLVWNVRVMDLRYWGMDILVPTVVAGLVIAAHRSRVSHPIAQAAVALCVLAIMQSVMSFLSVTVQGGLEAAATFSLWDATAYLILAGIPSAVAFILVLAVAEIDRLLMTRRVRRVSARHDVVSRRDAVSPHDAVLRHDAVCSRP
ncbi:hypothetical protein [Brevibacterium yomogidense]|uniref:Uncharacterized protein n=1 Tax=Brevibacterium yomogidense TaxID=946573 RepID=A0A1X6XL63_9MICO|nr:hypothetical protein [Brevibacterium yomogidense]SLN00021.1 hypothetical protein FM105_12065 [Brevibacterium yomogidense]